MTETLCQCGRPAGSAYLCTQCRRTYETALQRIPEHAADLQLVRAKLTRYGTGNTGGRSAGKTQPLVVDHRFLDGDLVVQPGGTGDPILGSGTRLLGDLDDTLKKWCLDVMGDHPNSRGQVGPFCAACLHSSCLAYRRSRWPRGNVSTMCDYLAGWSGWVAAQRWAPQILDELLDLERRLERFVDRPAQSMFVGPCLLCAIGGDDVGLYVLDEHATEVTCRVCEITWDVRQRRSWMIADMADRLVSAKEARRAIDALAGITLGASTIEVWAHRGKLRQHIVNGLPRYRIGDVYDLVTTREEQTS